jgi:glutaredoxin 3
MPEIVIYTTVFCPYCHAAKDLLKRKGAPYREIDVTGNPEGRRRMTEKAGGRHTVPQIFIGGRHVGGCDDLYVLDRRGELDRLLQPQEAGR